MDEGTTRAAVTMLGILGALSIAGCCILATTGGHEDGGLCTLAGTCIGALAALIAPKQRGTRPNNEL